MEDHKGLFRVTEPKEIILNEYTFFAECQVKGCGWKRKDTVNDSNEKEAEGNFRGVNAFLHRQHEDSIKITRLKD